MEKGKYLDSWKDIAAYLGRNIRTCRNWERDLGLPIHRLEGSPKSHVFAYTGEIDAWREMKGRLPNATIEQVVLGALEKAHGDRYRTTEDLLADLEALAEGAKPKKTPTGLLRGRILGIRKPVFYATLAALSAVAAFFVFAVLIPAERVEVFDSIAILPILNESGDPSKDHIANSMTTLITSQLYKVGALRVAPQETVEVYRDSKLSPAEIASALGVKVIVRGSIFSAGNKIRLTATLSDPFKKRILWAETLEQEEADILILQSRLCQAVVKGIRVAVTPDEASRLTSGHKVNPAAFDLVMQGIDFWMKTAPSLSDYYSKCMEYFQRAIDIEPSLAIAHAWIGNIYWQAAYNQYENPKSALKKAKDAGLRAIELDDDLSVAHSVLANVKFYLDWDFNGAEAEFKKALEIEPGNESLTSNYEQFLAYIGRFDESIASLKARKRKFEGGAGSLVELYQCAGRYDEALEEQIKAHKSAPSGASALWLALSYALKGMYHEALPMLEELMRNPVAREDPITLGNYALILALSGRREEALGELKRLERILSKRNTPTEYFAAAVYAALGDKERAFEYLYRSYENRWPFLVFCRSDPWFHRLHGDPRFEELIRKMGFPELTSPSPRGE